MHYTVSKLAKLSGVTVRTLRFYDEVGLLSPAYVAENGYRYYSEAQLLLLQQILFFREIGFELKNIKEILKQTGFDKVESLRLHKKVLYEKIGRMKQLVDTISTTITYLEDRQAMDEKDIFTGFDTAKQNMYEEMLYKRYGQKIESHMKQSRQKTKDWVMQDWQKSGEDFDAICSDLAELIKQQKSMDSQEVQAIIKRHYQWLQAFWIPCKDSYIGLGQGYCEKEWNERFKKYGPHFAEHLAEGMKIFAEKNLL